MDELNPRIKITLPTSYQSSFYGIVFDGCYFYLTAPKECSIYKLQHDFTVIQIIKTDKPYSCICYDNTINCFWATERKHKDIIYKLNCSMKEIGLLRVINCDKTCSLIMGISYDCRKDILLLAYKEHIVQVSKESGCTHIVKEICEGFFATVLSISPYYVVTQQDDRGQYIHIFTYEGRHFKSVCIPAFYKIKDVLFYPCSEYCQDEIELILLVTKNGCDQNIILKINICDLILYDCNYKVCHKNCRKEESPQCACDIIKSIALIETSLSHILNAEGEKLQKAVKIANSVDELLATNRSVTKTIISVTQLEYNLYLKLDALNDTFSD